MRGLRIDSCPPLVQGCPKSDGIAFCSLSGGSAMEHGDLHAGFDTGAAIGCEILIESRVKPEVMEQIRHKGHELMVRKEYSATMGRGQTVLHDCRSGINYGASEPRADDSAEPEPITERNQ